MPVGRIATERLLCDRPTDDDLDALVALWDDERVTATLGGRRARPEVEQALAQWQQHWADHGFGPFTVRDPGTHEVIGWCGLRWTTVAGERAVEVLYAIAADRWGQGLTTEAARRMVELADDDLAIEELVAFTLTTNLASQRVMQKCGFTYDRDIDHANLPHVLYRRRRPRPVGRD